MGGTRKLVAIPVESSDSSDDTSNRQRRRKHHKQQQQQKRHQSKKHFTKVRKVSQRPRLASVSEESSCSESEIETPPPAVVRKNKSQKQTPQSYVDEDVLEQKIVSILQKHAKPPSPHETSDDDHLVTGPVDANRGRRRVRPSTTPTASTRQRSRPKAPPATRCSRPKNTSVKAQTSGGGGSSSGTAVMSQDMPQVNHVENVEPQVHEVETSPQHPQVQYDHHAHQQIQVATPQQKTQFVTHVPRRSYNVPTGKLPEDYYNMIFSG